MLGERMGSPMNLNEAMREVIRQAGTLLTTRQITDEINRHGLYVRPSDGRKPRINEVSARAHNYSSAVPRNPNWFYRTPDGRIGLL